MIKDTLSEHLISHLIFCLARFIFLFVMTLFGDRRTLGRATVGKPPLSHFISPYTVGMATSFLQTHRWACGPGLDSVFYPLGTALRWTQAPIRAKESQVPYLMPFFPPSHWHGKCNPGAAGSHRAHESRAHSRKTPRDTLLFLSSV